MTAKNRRNPIDELRVGPRAPEFLVRVRELLNTNHRAQNFTLEGAFIFPLWSPAACPELVDGAPPVFADEQLVDEPAQSTSLFPHMNHRRSTILAIRHFIESALSVALF